MKTLKTIAVISLTGVLFSATSGTFAEEVQSQSIDVRSRVVTFYDLDLNKPKDAQTLLNRIQRAAKNVCRGSDHGGDVHAALDRNRCMASSYQDTVARVDNRFNTDIKKIAGMTEEPSELVSRR